MMPGYLGEESVKARDWGGAKVTDVYGGKLRPTASRTEDPALKDISLEMRSLLLSLVRLQCWQKC